MHFNVIASVSGAHTTVCLFVESLDSKNYITNIGLSGKYFLKDRCCHVGNTLTLWHCAIYHYRLAFTYICNTFVSGSQNKDQFAKGLYIQNSRSEQGRHYKTKNTRNTDKSKMITKGIVPGQGRVKTPKIRRASQQRGYAKTKISKQKASIKENMAYTHRIGWQKSRCFKSSSTGNKKNILWVWVCSWWKL